MSTLSLHGIGLRPAQWRAVEKKARHAGKSTREYVRDLIERELSADRSFDEILAPIRRDFRERGVTPDQLENMVRRARRRAAGGSRRARR